MSNNDAVISMDQIDGYKDCRLDGSERRINSLTALDWLDSNEIADHCRTMILLGLVVEDTQVSCESSIKGGPEHQ